MLSKLTTALLMFLMIVWFLHTLAHEAGVYRSLGLLRETLG